MDESEYIRIGKELQNLIKRIPLNWGRIQNNKTDSKINMFACYTIGQLEKVICGLNENEKIYFRRRWFIWQCSRIDEYLFCKSFNVKANPNPKDQDWDIVFYNNNGLRFDIKGTVVPKSMRKNFNTNNEKKIINFYYENQSKGIRYKVQNRLFIVHHSFHNQERSIYLRCHWKLKEKAYDAFVEKLRLGVDFVKYETVISKCIYILENENKEFSFKIN